VSRVALSAFGRIEGVAPNAASRVIRPDPGVAEPIDHHRRENAPTPCKSMNVAETGSSDSVTLALLLASVGSLFYQRMAIPKKPALVDRAYRTNRGVLSL